MHVFCLYVCYEIHFHVLTIVTLDDHMQFKSVAHLSQTELFGEIEKNYSSTTNHLFIHYCARYSRSFEIGLCSRYIMCSVSSVLLFFSF